MARAVLPGVPHHLTQRGTNHQDIFFSDINRHTYLNLAATTLPQFGVKVLAYCLMNNHVHWVIVPESADGLARAFGHLHGRYAQHINTALGRSGHFWQNRFFSCALDQPHTWAALRYVERNPVRAGLIPQSEHWPWSSASVRLNADPTPIPLDLESWSERFSTNQWRILLAADTLADGEAKLRNNTYTGRPVGEAAFIQNAEVALNRKLNPGKGGRPRKPVEAVQTA